VTRTQPSLPSICSMSPFPSSGWPRFRSEACSCCCHFGFLCCCPDLNCGFFDARRRATNAATDNRNEPARFTEPTTSAATNPKCGLRLRGHGSICGEGCSQGKRRRDRLDQISCGSGDAGSSSRTDAGHPRMGRLMELGERYRTFLCTTEAVGGYASTTLQLSNFAGEADGKCLRGIKEQSLTGLPCVSGASFVAATSGRRWRPPTH
jgi:hypothetical protein